MTSTAPIIEVQFKGRRKFESLGQCLEREILSGRFYARIRIHRGAEARQFPKAVTRISLPGTTENAARKNLTRLLDQFDQFELGRGENPFAKRAEKLTFAELVTPYLTAGCPTRSGQARQGKQLDEEKRRVSYLLEHFGTKPWNAITVEDWHRYRRARADSRQRKNCTGDRAIDLERKAFDAVFRLAILHRTSTGVSENPIPSVRFHHSDQVRHARDVMPASGDELHQIAAFLFQDPGSQALAWLLLFQAKIGHRIGTMVELRTDAAPGEPGFVEHTGQNPKILYLVRRRSHKGTHGHRRIDAELRLLLQAHAVWLRERYPSSPWFFPSPIDPAKHVDPGSLTGAEERACRVLQIPKRTSHGNRAFSINCLRSERTAAGFQKIPDAEIAILHGQKSAKEIIEVYGDTPATPLTWSPADRANYAWNALGLRLVQLELGI